MVTDALKRLIEAVAAGTATGGPDDITVPLEQSDLIVAAVGDDERWSQCVAAHDGSLDAALELLADILPDHTWGRAPEGQMWVRQLGGPFVWSGDDHPPARGLLLAVLRAKLVEAQQETSD